MQRIVCSRGKMNFNVSAFTFLLLVINETGVFGRQIKVSGTRFCIIFYLKFFVIRINAFISYLTIDMLEKTNISWRSVATQRRKNTRDRFSHRPISVESSAKRRHCHSWWCFTRTTKSKSIHSTILLLFHIYSNCADSGLRVE